MSEFELRNPHDKDIPALRLIWNNVFGNIGEDAFFRHYYSSELCIVADINNAPAAVGYLVPFGDLMHGSNSMKCAMIYSVTTVPEQRGKGLGTAVVDKLIALAYEKNYPVVVLCPSDDSLFNYYSKHTSFHECFFAYEQIVKQDELESATTPPVTEISVSEYKQMRESLLEGRTFIKHDLRCLEYQEFLFNELGGGFFKVGDSCAAVEVQPDGSVLVKELLSGNDHTLPDIITSVATKFSANEYVVRYPAHFGKGRRFGMITLSEHFQPNLNDNSFAPAGKLVNCVLPLLDDAPTPCPLLLIVPLKK